MFEYLELNMWPDGTEHCMAYSSFDLDEREIFRGTSYRLENNCVKNNWRIEKWNTDFYVGVVASGKDETLTLSEFKQWLEKNKVPDAYMDWLRKNPDYVKQHPKMCGAEYV